MTSIRFVSVSQWPGKPTPSRDREQSRFRAPYNDTLDLLDRELFQLSARNVVIQAYLETREIRNDGWPYSKAQPSQPGVILSFEKLNEDTGRYEEVSFPCDRFNQWEDNLRAIALALEALRKVDRYGITQHGEQYKGWTRLPPPSNGSHAEPEMTREDAIDFIAKYAGVRSSSVAQEWQQWYRIAARKLHPDSGGSHEDFVRLQKARDILESRI